MQAAGQKQGSSLEDPLLDRVVAAILPNSLGASTPLNALHSISGNDRNNQKDMGLSVWTL